MGNIAERVKKTDVSARLFFAKLSSFDTVWHICDAALGYGQPGGQIKFMALHGTLIYPLVRCDTLLEVELRGTRESFCERCLQEMILAGGKIDKKDLLKFQ